MLPQNTSEAVRHMKDHPNRKPPRTAFGAAVREARDQIHASQATVAALLGVSPATLNRVELGKHRPTRKTEQALRKMFRELPPVDEEVVS